MGCLLCVRAFVLMCADCRSSCLVCCSLCTIGYSLLVCSLLAVDGCSVFVVCCVLFVCSCCLLGIVVVCCLLMFIIDGGVSCFRCWW